MAKSVEKLMRHAVANSDKLALRQDILVLPLPKQETEASSTTGISRAEPSPHTVSTKGQMKALWLVLTSHERLKRRMK